MEPGREGASGGGEHTGEGGTEPQQERPGGAEETGVVPHGSEAGEASEAVDAGEAAQQPEANEPATDTTGGGATGKPETAKPEATAGEAAEHQPAAETAEQPGVKKATKTAQAIADAAKTSDVLTKVLRAIQKGEIASEVLKENKAALDPILSDEKKFTIRPNADDFEEAAKLFGAAKKPKKKAETDEDGKVVAVGEYLHNARRDKYKWSVKGIGLDDLDKMSDQEKKDNLTKQNIWPKPDYVAAVDGGADATVMALIKRIYDRIGVKNTSSYEVEGETRNTMFIKALNATQEVLEEAKTIEDVKKAARAISDKLGPNSYSLLTTLRQKNSRQSPLQVYDQDVRAAEAAVRAGWPNQAPWTRLFEVNPYNKRPEWGAINSYVEYRDGDATKILENNGIALGVSFGRGDEGDTLTLHEWGSQGAKKIDPTTLTGKAKEAWDKLTEMNAAASIKKLFVARQKSGKLVGEFKTREEAEAAAKAAYEKLGEDRKGEGEYPDRPHLEKIERSGPDYRKGKNITAKDFMDTFGFRGVDFGNWAANDERQRLVNFAFDALHDMARVIGIKPKAVSLNGQLGISFGSRGQGGRGAGAAHYEPGSGIINMTKMNGAGSLAHEWGHALDDYLGKPVGSMGLSGGRWTPKHSHDYWNNSSFLGQKTALKPKLRQAVNKLMHDNFNVEEDDTAAVERVEKEVEEAKKTLDGWISWGRNHPKNHRKTADAVQWWENKIKRLNDMLDKGFRKKIVPSNYVTESQKISGKGDYWVRPEELFARSWESFIFDKLKAEGFQSQYLVQGVEETRFGPGYRGNPYPAGEERKRINADYERLLKAMSAVEGIHGEGTKIEAAEGVPEPIVTVTHVKRPEKPAVDPSKPKTLDEAFAGYLGAGEGFDGIIAARKFAKDKGFDAEPKAVEEALEFAVVKVARQIAQQAETPGTRRTSRLSISMAVSRALARAPRPAFAIRLTRHRFRWRTSHRGWRRSIPAPPSTSRRLVTARC